MIDGIAFFWFLAPILLVLFTFGGGLLIRLCTRAAHPERDEAYRPMVSVLLPVFNEGAHVLQTLASIMACDWPADRLEVVAVDDCSADDSYAYVQQAAARWPGRMTIRRNPVNQGKHKSLSTALGLSRGEILICIDSDCIFDCQVIRELVCCFANPRVGAVGGHIGITNVNVNAFTVCQTLVYFMSFHVGKMLQNIHGRVFCISGCLFAVRRHLFEAVEPQVKNRNWFGLGVRDGEDRYMTHAILMRGWQTVINPRARCWTAAPERMKELFSQQIRWRRSGLRDLFWTWARLPAHFRVMSLPALLTGLLPETFTVLWSFLMLSMLPALGLAAAAETVVGALLMFCSVFIVAALAYNASVDRLAAGSQKIANPALAGLSGAWFFMDSLLVTMLALFTFDVGSWGTRETPKGGAPVEPATAAPEARSAAEIASLALARPAAGAAAAHPVPPSPQTTPSPREPAEA